MISPMDNSLRRRQAVGLILVACAILAFSAIRAGWHAIFLARWWRF